MTDTTPQSGTTDPHGSTPPSSTPGHHDEAAHRPAPLDSGSAQSGPAVGAALAADLSSFVMRSPSSYHAAYAVRERLVDAGFDELDEDEHWSLEPGGRYVVVRDGAVIAFAAPASDTPPPDRASAPAPTTSTSTAPTTGPTADADPAPAARAALPFHVVGAHTDSPGFKLKPQPDVVAEGALQAGVEIYGGPLLNSW